MSHAHVGQYGVEGPLAHQGHGRGAVVRLLHAVAPSTQYGTQHGPVGLIIVYNKNKRLSCHDAVSLWGKSGRSGRVGSEELSDVEGAGPRGSGARRGREKCTVVPWSGSEVTCTEPP